MLGGSLSVVVGYFLAGWLNEFYGWRVTFIVLGLPGLALAALARFSLREPRCGKATIDLDSQLSAPALFSPETAMLASDDASLRDVCMTLWTNTTFRHLLFGLSVVYFFGYGLLLWQTAFLVLSY